MNPLQYLTMLQNYAGQNGLAIDANTINVFNNEFVANRIYANIAGATTVPKKDGTPYAKGDLVKIQNPLLGEIEDTEDQILAEQNGVKRPKGVFESFLKEFKIDVDKSLKEKLIDASEVEGFGTFNEFVLLRQVVYLLKWADFFNQEFLKVVVKTLVLQPTHYEVITQAITKDETVDKILDLVALMKNEYGRDGLSITDEQVVLYLNTKASHSLTQYLKIDTGNNNGASADGTTPIVNTLLKYKIIVDDRINKFLASHTTASALNPLTPVCIADIMGGVAQEINVIQAFGMVEGKVVNTFEPKGRALCGTARIAPNKYIFAFGPTAFAEIDPDLVRTDKAGQGLNDDGSVDGFGEKVANQNDNPESEEIPETFTFDEPEYKGLTIFEKDIPKIKDYLGVSPKTKTAKVLKLIKSKKIPKDKIIEIIKK